MNTHASHTHTHTHTHTHMHVYTHTHTSHTTHTYTHTHTFTADMGCGEPDDSYQMETEQPSMNTTNHIQEQLDDIDFVMHIGDMSYALGYSSVVRGDAVATQDSLLWATAMLFSYTCHIYY